jgi:hypothetical protein
MAAPEPPRDRSDFYKRTLLAPVWIAVLIAWSILSNSDTAIEKIIKPVFLFFSTETRWNQWGISGMISNLPLHVWLIGALVIIASGATETGYRFYRDARRRGDKAIVDFENYKTKQLELTWNPEEEPYRWWDMGQKPAPALYFRLRVKNISGATINGIKVELSELIPRELICVPCPIRLMNNILPRDVPEREFSLNPGDKCFIDLMLQSRSMDTFWILHTVQGISEAVPKKPYRMVIRISAINVPEIVRRYELIEDGEMWRLQEVTDQ